MDKFNATCWIIMTILHTVCCKMSASCADSCVGKTSGNYQYCPDCHQYMACSNGYKYVMPCPANLVWDDAKKRCEWTSSTCYTNKNTSTRVATNTGCDDSCVGKTSGNYQYCPDCHQYMACSNGYKYVMPCPDNLVWDDTTKSCEWTSSTCNTHKTNTTTAALNTGCDDTCVGKTSGNYQYCLDCHQYMACSNGNKYVMSCPANLVWDDAKKSCKWTSSTCNLNKNITTTAATNTACVDSCLGRSDGNYQYCPDLHQYVACTNGYKYIIHCPANHLWDDEKKICKLESSKHYTSTKSTSVRTSTVKKSTPTPIPYTTDYLVKTDTTRHKSTTTRTIRTTAAKTPATTANPTSVTSCIQEKLSISLEKDAPIVTGNVPFISVLDGSNGNPRFGCSANVLLKATFQRNDLQSSLQGCNNPPYFGNKMLKIDLRLSSIINGISFHVGDSEHNIGSRQDESMQENDAEFYFLGYSGMLRGSRKCSSFTKDLTGLLNVNVSRVTVSVSNEFIRVTNNLGYSYDLCSSCLFALNGQPDLVDSRDEEIYIGLNRPIYSPYNRKGTGVCSAEISWKCS